VLHLQPKVVNSGRRGGGEIGRDWGRFGFRAADARFTMRHIGWGYGLGLFLLTGGALLR
jgi:hypothetical protein